MADPEHWVNRAQSCSCESDEKKFWFKWWLCPACMMRVGKVLERLKDFPVEERDAN